MLKGHGNWKETTLSSQNNIEVYDWDAKAILIVMDIIHGRTHQVPRSIDLELLAKIALVIDFFDCHEVVALHAKENYKNLCK